MRLSFIILATLVLVITLLANTNAEVTTKKTFTIASSDSDKQPDRLRANKFVILYDDDTKTDTLMENYRVDQVATSNDDSASDDSNGQEERQINTEAVAKLAKSSSTKYDSGWNKVLSKFFKSMTPKNYRPLEANMNTRTGRYHPSRINAADKI